MDLLVSLVVGCGQLAEVDMQSRSACPPLGEGGSPEQGAGGSLSVLGDAYSRPKTPWESLWLPAGALRPDWGMRSPF